MKCVVFTLPCILSTVVYRFTESIGFVTNLCIMYTAAAELRKLAANRERDLNVRSEGLLLYCDQHR